ncbi:tautomerase family protein [Amycolatopsis sp. SID8362]|uniref:tautomerase family protein n=1 Tax=Amycolatopsis sp. SID8362 TaxID=2690346 RepID=UPI0028165254|nr:tautomerase family protein [Amycolatopsis sp. SID8362]
MDQGHAASPARNPRGPHRAFHDDETSEDLWINGIVPPPGGSDAEKNWAKQNSAYPG